MDIVRDAQKYKDSIHFEIGQPDLTPSPKVKNALQTALDDDRFSYTESLGLLDLRKKISTMYKENYNVDVEPERILLTPGTSGAFLVAYTLTLNHKEKEFFQNSSPYLIIILAQATGQSNNCPCSPPVSRGFLYLFSFFSLCPFNRPSSIRSLRFCKKLDCPGSCFQCFF